MECENFLRGLSERYSVKEFDLYSDQLKRYLRGAAVCDQHSEILDEKRTLQAFLKQSPAPSEARFYSPGPRLVLYLTLYIFVLSASVPE
ncbi:hypothetical protein FKM82_025912 [Ascaphus truei]